MEPYIGEIRIFAGNFAPRGWAFCNGQLMPIAQNTALFSILGIVYGGDGKTTFALPNLEGRTPMHQGTGTGLTQRFIGESGGQASVELTVDQLPAHSHTANCQSTPGQNDPNGAIWSNSPSGRGKPSVYAETSNTTMNHQAIQSTGGNQAHNNRQPYTGLNHIIALQGVFPPHS
jgi:microcystin-dependent protein